MIQICKGAVFVCYENLIWHCFFEHWRTVIIGGNKIKWYADPCVLSKICHCFGGKNVNANYGIIFILLYMLGNPLQTVILASSVLYELAGPACAKLSLYLSGSYSTKLEELAPVPETGEDGVKKTEEL